MPLLRSPARTTATKPGARPATARAEKPRVLFVVAKLAFGGAEVQVIDLAAHIQAAGWEVKVVSLLPPTHLTDRLEGLRIAWRSLDGRKGGNPLRLLHRLRKEVVAWRPDIVHSHTLPANFVARAVRPLAPIPALITSCHNVNEGGRAKMLYYRLTERYADFTTNVSHAAVDRYIQIGAASPGRIHYMPNGIGTGRFMPDPARRAVTRQELGITDPGTFVWLAVGRLQEQKDYPNMLRAAAHSLGPNHRLFIVGAGVLEDEIRRMINDLGLGDRVQLLGLRSDMPDLMRAADGYLMSSAWEGLPIVLLEAAASGLPIVSTRVGGNDEIVKDGATGFLVAPHDDAALADAMRRLQALEPEQLAGMARAARQHVMNTFGMAHIADRWLDIYTRLLARNGPGVTR